MLLGPPFVARVPFPSLPTASCGPTSIIVDTKLIGNAPLVILVFLSLVYSELLKKTYQSTESGIDAKVVFFFSSLYTIKSDLATWYERVISAAEDDVDLSTVCFEA